MVVYITNDFFKNCKFPVQCLPLRGAIRAFAILAMVFWGMGDYQYISTRVSPKCLILLYILGVYKDLELDLREIETGMSSPNI